LKTSNSRGVSSSSEAGADWCVPAVRENSWISRRRGLHGPGAGPGAGVRREDLGRRSRREADRLRLRFDWKTGSDDAYTALASGGAIVTDRFAEDHDLGVGDRFQVTAIKGDKLDLSVAGISERTASTRWAPVR
jgi:hypothetical protein